MSFYDFSILLTELLMLAMTLHVLRYSGFKKQQKAWYLITFLAVMFSAAGEYLAIRFDGCGPAYALPLTVITVIQFSLTPLLPVFFAGALGMHRLAEYAGVFFALNVAAETISAFNGAIYYFDENATYFRGEYYIIYESFYIISLLFLIVSLFFVGKRFHRRDTVTIVMVLVVMVAGIVPMILSKIYTDYICIAISASLCYIYYNDLVQQDVKAEVVENQEKISRMQGNIISGLANLIENRDTETGEHVSRTGNYVRMIAEDARKDGVYKEQLTDRFISLLRTLAPMHDIGKIVVSDLILKKPGRLTPEEFEQMKRHAAAGGDVVREVLRDITDEETVSFAADIATCHHERWDGTGYPAGLKGDQIPLSARIMAIADVYDALISERCYKEPMPVEEAFRVIREEAGSHFDPYLVTVFLNHKEDFEKPSK